jgi:hypothetical protein
MIVILPALYQIQIVMVQLVLELIVLIAVLVDHLMANVATTLVYLLLHLVCKAVVFFWLGTSQKNFNPSGGVTLTGG